MAAEKNSLVFQVLRITYLAALKYDNCDTSQSMYYMCLAHGELLGNEGKEGAMCSFMKGFLYNFLDISISGYKQNVELFKNFEE